MIATQITKGLPVDQNRQDANAGSAAQEGEPTVVAERRGRTGFILLNRPKALNALSGDMIARMHAALIGWADDDSVDQVVVHGAGERGLCAGGDIVAVYKDFTDGDGSASEHFFRSEYSLDNYTAEYPKPYVAIMDGLVLGGGVGISAHGSVRVATERTRLGMPETGIGFLPDVGATYLLPRVPGELGTYMALTGEMVSGADAVALGLADVVVESAKLEELMKAVEEEPVADVLARLKGEAPESELLAQREWIDEAFAGSDPREIVARLREGGHGDVADTIESKSPTSTFVTLELLREGAGQTLREAFDAELEAGMHLIRSGEMIEGIRAQVVDKDKSPKWSPGRLEDVSQERVDEILGR